MVGLRRALVLALVGSAFVLPACGEDPNAITAERLPRRVESEIASLADPPTFGMTRHIPPPAACELGQTLPCFPQGMGLRSISSGGFDDLRQRCVEWPDGSRHWNRAACDTPLVVSFDTSEPVIFTRPIATTFAVGAAANTEWVSAKTPWLALDANGNGCVDDEHELFGPPEDGAGMNGFDKLRRLDANHDGLLDEHDPAFASLVLWFDRDQDKRCLPSEIATLRSAGIVGIELAFTRPRAERPGSFEGETSTLWLRGPDGGLRAGRLIDVYLAPAP
jgi:hypothetical protein